MRLQEKHWQGGDANGSANGSGSGHTVEVDVRLSLIPVSKRSRALF